MLILPMLWKQKRESREKEDYVDNDDVIDKAMRNTRI